MTDTNIHIAFEMAAALDRIPLGLVNTVVVNSPALNVLHGDELY